MNIKSVITAVIISTLSIGHAGSASTWPDQPVTFIVPFAAGGGGDTAARILQNRLSQELNQPVVIQNLAGASGIVGTAAIKKANSDGLTIGLSLGSTIGTGQIFNQSLPYDYINDFEYIAVLGEIPRGIFVSQNSPYKTVDDLVTASKNQVNTNFGVGGNSPEHLAALIFNAATGGQHQLIPYTANTNTMIIDLLGGRLDAVWQSMPAMASCLQDKSCRPLAFTSSTRYPTYLTIPTFTELGLAQVNAPSYYGIVAPKNVPVAKLERLSQAVNTVLLDPEIKTKLFSVGLVVTVKNLKDSKKVHFDAVDAAKKAAPLLSQDKK